MVKIRNIIFIIIFIWISFFVVDFIRSKSDSKPIFCIQTQSYEDGGSVKYTGLFYNVYSLNYYNPDINKVWYNEDGSIKDEYVEDEFIKDHVITPWFYSIDKVKDRYK